MDSLATSTHKSAQQYTSSTTITTTSKDRSSMSPPELPNATSHPATTMVMSSIRRKPKVTYHSPSAHVPADLRIEGPTAPFSRTLSLKLAASTPSSPKLKPSTSTKFISKTTDKNGMKPVVKKEKYPMGPPLPLYHPLGRLALSLPELDPVSLGFPTSLAVEDSSRRSSARARRPAAKLREAEDDASSTSATASAALDVIAKEKPSPRKRRAGGGGGKRKRKETDDGDATYPAKRTRNPRATREPVSPTESPVPDVETPAPAASEMSDEKEKKPERRVTRARGAITRRDSSASEATATSVSVSVAATAMPNSNEAMDVQIAGSKDEKRSNADPNDKVLPAINGKEEGEEKEEGEMSEGATTKDL